jgi:hypothetical protein
MRDPYDWEEQFERLVTHEKKQKTTSVPRKSSNLGNWVTAQRRKYKAGKLPKEKIVPLESIGFVWRDVLENTLSDMYERLVAYKKKLNTTCVPRKEDAKLSIWISNQRVRCKEKDLIDLLNDIDFVWNTIEATSICISALDACSCVEETCSSYGLMHIDQLRHYLLRTNE